MGIFVLNLRDIDQTQVSLAGGKGAHLGALARLGGIRVPAGFCVTTDAFRRIVTEASSIDELLGELSHLGGHDRVAIQTVSAAIRHAVERVVIPDDLADEIGRSVTRLGDRSAYAVRSSATAEDLPTASFAGQQDTYLNVVGVAETLRHISRCWASLFTERAVTYRLRNGFDHRGVRMAVVVQRMVFPRAAGILFTADPVTSNRTVVSIEAGFGLGEALVSGRVDADVYKVRDGGIVAKEIATKRLATRASPVGGTLEVTVEPERQREPALTDGQVLQLAQLGRRIEAHFGQPQDIEWCLVDGGFQFVQSRPITTLFPIPIPIPIPVAGDREGHVYVSVGHQQMMTDPMKPLGVSFWQLTAAQPMSEAGGRLFVDVARDLASPTSGAALLGVLGRSDPLIGDALRTILERGDLVPTLLDDGPDMTAGGDKPGPVEAGAALVAELIERSRASIARLNVDIATKSGPALLDFILADIQELKRILFDPESLQVIRAGIEATRWLNEQLQAWLGEKNAADVLTRSVPHNITSEMGLALLDVADVIRPHPEVVSFLQKVENDSSLDGLPELAGGREASDAIRAFLAEYGMRGAGEIDITRPRWSERPTALVPVIVGNIKNFGPGEGKRRFEQGRQEALKKEREVLERLRALPDGERKAEEARLMIDRVRCLVGYREYPKYGMVSHYFVYKQALLEEAGRLVQAGVLGEQEDIFYLTLREIDDVVRSNQVDDRLIGQRKEAFRSYRALTPPRVLTSDGEVIAGAYRRDDVPAGAMVGLPVSAGTVEGRARVVLDMARADLEEGDILVTTYTDPSWTPLFVAIAGLVTEVGGLMTHGAVVAREYGLPAVVGVEEATRLIPDGQRIRVHGTDGYVEILG